MEIINLSQLAGFPGNDLPVQGQEIPLVKVVAKKSHWWYLIVGVLLITMIIRAKRK